MVKRVFFVHGIRDAAGNGHPADDWYLRLETVFSPHFQCESIRYREFHDLLLGGPALFIWAWTPLFAASFILLLASPSPFVMFIFPLVALLIALFEEHHWSRCWPSRRDVWIHMLPFVAGAVVAGGLHLLEQSVWVLSVPIAVAGWYAADVECRGVEPTKPGWSVLFLKVVMVLGTLSAAWTVLRWDMLGFLATMVVLGIFAFAEPAWRKGRSHAAVLARLGRLGHERPHIIAHSLGTVLTHRALKSLTLRKWGRIICVGSVLPTDTEWWPIIGTSPNLLEIHNETAKKDGFVKLAYRLERILRRWVGLGGAGYSGFRPNQEFHDGPALQQPCPSCVGGGSCRIHNWGVTENRHSTSLLTEDHARFAWLPMLWGWHPADCNDFFERAQLAVECMRERDADGFTQHARHVGSMHAWWGPLDDSRRRLLDYAESCLRDTVGNQSGRGPAPVGEAFWAANPKVYLDFFHALFLEAAARVATHGATTVTELHDQFRMVSPFEVVAVAVEKAILAHLARQRT